MKKKRIVIAKRALALFWLMLGIDCQGDIVLTPIRKKLGQIEWAQTAYAINNNGKISASLDELLQFASTNYDHRGKPLLTKEDLLDQWGEPFAYERRGRWYTIRSSGPDRIMGTEDDWIDGVPLRNVEKPTAERYPPADGSETNAVQKAAAEPVQPTATEGGATASPPSLNEALQNTATKEAPQKDAPAESNPAPWGLPLLTAAAILGGALAAWRCFRKRGTV